MQRGRKSAAALTVVQGDYAPMPAPLGLTEIEKTTWTDLVMSRPADWFGVQHVPIMTEYVRSVCRAHVVDQQIKGFLPEWFVTDEGLGRYNTFLGMAARLAVVIHKLATSMRITHHSVYEAKKAGMKAKPGPKIWQREAE